MLDLRLVHAGLDRIATLLTLLDLRRCPPATTEPAREPAREPPPVAPAPAPILDPVREVAREGGADKEQHPEAHVLPAAATWASKASNSACASGESWPPLPVAVDEDVAAVVAVVRRLPDRAGVGAAEKEDKKSALKGARLECHPCSWFLRRARRLRAGVGACFCCTTCCCCCDWRRRSGGALDGRFSLRLAGSAVAVFGVS